MVEARPSPEPTPPNDIVGEFRRLSDRILALAARGVGRDAFVTDVLDTLIDRTGCDRASLRLPQSDAAIAWTRAAGDQGLATPWEVPVAPPGPKPPTGLAWRRRLDPEHVSSTQLGTVWTRRGGIQGLADLPDEERPVHLRDVAVAPSTVSVLLIPVVVGAASVGLLQLESRRDEAFEAGRSRALEGATQILGAALVTQRAQWALRERVKEMTCLYEIARITERTDLPLEEVLAGIAATLPKAWQHPEVASARIVLDGVESSRIGPHPARDVLTAAIFTKGRRRGFVEVGYAAPQPDSGEGPFLVEERSLLDAVAAEIGSLIERRQAAEERDRLEEQLRHADRLATIGTLAAGVAHELNEPLGTILGFAQLSARAKDVPAPVAQDLQRIQRAALHAREVVRKLVTFGRQAALSPERVDLGRVVEDGLYFLEARCAKGGIVLEREVEAGDLTVVADPSQLHQVIVNLVVNAVQAMPGGGRLVVRAHRKGAEAVLEVEDTGCGMTADVLDRIFTPFFTTKDVGEGTGLGLSVVHGIVASHKGTVDVESAPGRGSCFRVRLPAAPAAEGETA